MNRLKKFYLSLCLAVTAAGVHAQIAGNLLMPPTVDMTKSGWDVTLQQGNLTFGLPIASVPGEVPIQVSFGMNATFTATTKSNWIIDPEWGGRVLVTNEIDRPMVGGIHFGYISDASTYSGTSVESLTVLESGYQVADSQWTLFSSHSSLGTTLNLPQAYGFSPVSTSTAKVDPTAAYLAYTTTAANLGSTYQSIVQNLTPTGFGTGSTNYKVVLDKDKARIYAYATSVQAWVPILWADRFGHYVTFQWNRATASLPSGVTAITKVTATTTQGKGVVLRWADYASTGYERDILRLDFVGVRAPSVTVKGYPGWGGTPAGFISLLPPDNEWTVVPSIIGSVCRPTSIQVGAFEPLSQPFWSDSGSAAALAPGSPPVDGTSNSAIRTWTFAYDSAKSELISLTQPNGLTFTFLYANYPLTTVGATKISPRGVSEVRATGAGVSQNLRWTRTYPSGSNPMSVKIEGWWDPNQMASPDRYHQIIFPTDSLNFGNGVYQVDSLKDISGKTWRTTTYAYTATGGGMNAGLSSVQSVTVQEDGTPTFSTALGYLDSSNLQMTQSNVSAKNVSGTVYPVSSTTNTYASRWDMLEGHQLTQISTIRYAPNGTALPAVIQKNIYDTPGTGPSLLQLQKSYVDGGTTGQHGSLYGYDLQGRLSTQIVHHVEGTQSQTAPNFVITSYDASSGMPLSRSNVDQTVSPARFLTQSMAGFDSAGRATQVTDPSGITTSYTFDDRGRVLSSLRPGSPTTNVAYYTEPAPYSSEIRIETTTAGQTSITSYDALGRIRLVTKPLGVGIYNTFLTQAPTYDVYGRLVRMTEVQSTGSTRSENWTYDPLDRVLSHTPPVGGTITTTYAASGINSSVTTTLANQVSTTTLKDPLGQVVQVNAPDGSVTRITYDGTGNQVGLTVTSSTGLVQTRSWTYDTLGRLTSKSEPETNTQLYTGFNALNQPTRITEAAGTSDERVRTVAYDGFGRMVSMAGGTDNVSYTYTGQNLTSSSRTTGGQTVSQAFAYQGAGGRLSSEMTIQPGLTTTIGYVYDNNGQLTSLTYPSGRVVGYGYDSLGRITSITNNGAPLVSSIRFDDWGNRWQTQFASGAQDQWDADLTGTRLKDWYIGYVGGGPEGRGYSYDEATNILKTAGEWSLTHDSLNRLTEADGFGIKTAHTHDSFGNNISHSATSNGSPVPPSFNNFIFDPMANNQIPGLEKNGALTGWNTNRRGEATQVGVATSSSIAVGLGWDGLGLLKSAVWALGGSQSFLYSASGLRVSLDNAWLVGSRKYAYSHQGLLLSEFDGPVANVHSGQKALRIAHRPDQFSGNSRYLGTFNAGEVVTATIWFKAPNGVHGEMFLGDAGGADPYDNDEYVSLPGNGGWQQLTLTHTMTHDDAMWIYIYSDMWSVADYTKVPAHPGTIYDDVLVSGSVRGVVLNDGFEGGWPLAASSWLDATSWTNNVEGSFQEVLGQQDPGLWRREVIYLGTQAIAEIDAAGVHELHSDHLGSPRLITKGAGNWDGSLVGTIDGTQAYGPYGELISQTGYVPLTGYTGHAQTDDSGLIYMRGRYYSPAWHAFVSSDQGLDPNSLNQRAYGVGSPFMTVDPTGNMILVNINGQWYWAEWGAGGGWIETGNGLERGSVNGEGWSFTPYENPFSNWELPISRPQIPTPREPQGGSNKQPQTPKPEKRCPSNTPSKEPYFSLTVGGAAGPAYWTTLTMTSSSLYLSINHGAGGGLVMLSATGGLVTGNPNSVFTGVSGVATGGTPWGAGGTVQGNPLSGHAVDLGLSTPGGSVGMGYGFKLYDANDAQRNPQVFKDSSGKVLERCY